MKRLLNGLSLFDILILIGVLFVGTDKWAINLGINIRFVQIYYLAIILYLFYEKKYKLFINPIFVIFTVSALISTVFAINIMQAFPYLVWLIYYIIVLMPIIYLYVQEYGPKRLLLIFKYAFRVVVLLVILQFLIETFLNVKIPFLERQYHRGITRPALWFYEPSYLATFLLIYFGINSYNLFVERDKKSIFDLAITGIAIALVTSTTGFLGVALSAVLGFILYLKYAKSFKERRNGILLFLGISIIGVIGLYILMPNVFEVFILRIFKSGLVASAGNRIVEYKNQFDVFFNSPIFGVGLDCYGTFLGNSEIEATNISLELLATMGIIGFISFYSIIIYPIIVTFFSNNARKYKYTRPLVFGLVILIIILQANQNFMRLYLWLLIFSVYASMHYEKILMEENDENSN